MPLPLVSVTCPYCHETFKAPAKAEHAVCPYSRHRLRLVQVAPRNAAERVLDAERMAREVAVNGPPRASEALTRCPRCASEFYVDLTQTEATCPACDSVLELDPLEAAVGETHCPVCRHLFQVELDAARATCPNCHSVLDLARPH